MAGEVKNSFRLLRDYLYEQLAAPLNQFSFWAYLVLAVVIFGGLGVWVEVYKLVRHSPAGVGGFLSALYTYFPAIAFASSMQLVIREDQHRYVRSFALLVGTVLLGIAILHALQSWSETTSVITGVVACAISLLFWWITNATDSNLHDDPRNALGRSPQSEPAGNTNEFKT